MKIQQENRSFISDCIIISSAKLKKNLQDFSFCFFLFLFVLTTTSVIGQKVTAEKRVYIVAIDKEYEPYEFLNDENKADGFTPALLKEIGNSANVIFEFIPMTWGEEIDALKSGKVDLINMIYSSERATLFDFSQPHSQISQALFRTEKASDIVSLASLSGYKVGFQKNDISLQNMANRTDFKKFIFHSKLDGLLHLNIGELEAFFCAQQAGIDIISKHKLTNINLAYGELFNQSFAFATRKGNSQLIELLNSHLTKLQASGKLQELKDKWLSNKLKTASWLEKNRSFVLTLGGILCGTLILLLLWNRILWQRVTSKTKSLQASEEKLSSILNSMTEVVWSVSWPDFKLLYVGPSVEKLYGIPIQEFKDKPLRWREAIHPDDKQNDGNVFEQLKKEGFIENERRIIRPDGSIVWIHDRCHTVKDENGTILRIDGLVSDITDRKQAKQELIKAKEKAEENEIKLKEQVRLLDLIFAYTLDNIVLLDKDYNFIKVSETYAKSCQRDISDFNGRNHFDMYPSDFKDEADEVKRKKINYSKQARPFIYADHPEWGTTYWDLEFVPILDKYEEVEFFILTIKDVTEKVRAESKLIIQNEELKKAKEKAEESERLKTAFLANMSHEIRTPLNIITGYSEFLSEENLSKIERTEYISLINTNSMRLLNVINNILDLSKIEAGQKIVNLEIFNINKLIDELFEQNKKAAKEKQLELCVHKGLVNDQALIYSSEQLIYQVFTNLINNSIKYSLSGRIDFGYTLRHTSTLRQAQGSVAEAQGSLNPELELFVSDTGIGISKEYSSNLFKRFSQENSKLSRSYQGAGLGLSIVKGIVDLLNGTITVNSEKGKGTTFNITLPLEITSDKNEKHEGKIMQEEIKNDKQITLLIVEDDEACFYLLKKQILREFACEIIYETNGYGAIEKVKIHPEITCVLMDMHMPGIDGYETTERIKKIKKDLPVFAVTAATMDSDREKALNAGCDDFFSKPIDREKLFHLIVKYSNERHNNTNISTKENSTLLNITLPLEITSDKNEKHERTATLEVTGEKQTTLLIVEDDLTSFYLLNMQISEEFPCKIIHADNGLSAIEEVKAHPEITCVLMDLHMPGIDGYETTERIKEIKMDLPVFAVTAATLDRDREKASKAGCDEFFSKPVDRKNLYNHIVKYELERQNNVKSF